MMLVMYHTRSTDCRAITINDLTDCSIRTYGIVSIRSFPTQSSLPCTHQGSEIFIVAQGMLRALLHLDNG